MPLKPGLLRVVRRPQVETAWAAAAQVVISGAAGRPWAAFVNGRFEQVEREVYRKVEDQVWWLFVDCNGNWMVGTTAGKDARKTRSLGAAHSVASADGMPPPAGASWWQVGPSDSMWVEQTLEVEVLSAAQAREWAARHAHQVGAPAAASRATSLSLPTLRPGVGIFAADRSGNLLRVAWRPQVEAAWAAAHQVVLIGAAGLAAAKVNGRFEQVEREVYRKVGEPGLWLFVAKKGTWSVGATAGKDARKTESAGWAHSVALAGRMPPPVGTGQWHVHDDTKWAEQTLEVEVLDAAQAREWAEQVGALPSCHAALCECDCR